MLVAREGPDRIGSVIALAGREVRDVRERDMRQQVTTLVESAIFQRSIIAVIILNGITLGLETSEKFVADYGDALHALDRVILAIFVGELILRLYAHRWRFFTDPWSIFDLLVITISLVPAAGSLSVLRALRILRAMRLISAVPGMKKVVGGLLSALPGMASIVMLLGLVNYVGAVLATELYGPTAPIHFGNLGRSLFTLFQVMTGEAWPDIARDVMDLHPSAWIFFVVYILVSTFVVLNLFTAVVVSAMEPERREEAAVDATLLIELRTIKAEIAALRAELSERDEGPESERETAGTTQASGV
jgi:voltage-gated sodium channel